ncbi:type I methionyl aminopeptidase [Mucisphaera calidilacus]|uniref:Methionine aminopeptidase n=1 Tax=Mucisphaera calidilacus TaxID=2527982 RepID=A0A518BXS6_9BACT|nr:type I methionyl aminopeptidase [Mucisphaera calidilacus]QDU71756.1 Methionine aminopeptidase 1 [Mucisphaera calidilacus]
MKISTKTPEQIERMRASGRLVRKILDRCTAMCQPGVTTQALDNEAQRLIDEAGATGLFRGYPGPTPFPATLCISVNEEVVHGIASDRKVVEGDIVGVDCGVSLDGWCGDAATTIMVGEVKPEVRALCEATQHVLAIAIENMRPGRRWSQVAGLMQSYAESRGYGVVRDFVGHGIGRKLHEEPKVPNFVNEQLLRNDFELRKGMVLAVEPMCNLGTAEVLMLQDGWTVVTQDRLPAAHYEHTVAITADGTDVLTDGR